MTDYSKDWTDVFPDWVTPSGQVKRGLTTEQKTEVWIYRAKQIHGDKYDYSKFIVSKTTDPSVVLCPQHGTFNISPNKHVIAELKCPSCSTATKPLGTEGFIKRASEVHPGKYDYSLVQYINNRTAVDIKCLVHGKVFSQIPDAHLSGSGCPLCKGDTIRNLKRKSQNEFELEVQEMFGSSIAVVGTYETAHTSIEFRCSTHGIFRKDPHSVLKGTACPICSRMGVFNQVYLIHITGSIYKIGVTSSLDRRVATHACVFGKQIKLVKSTTPKILDPYEIESNLLNKYPNSPTGYAHLEGYTELRVLNEQEVLDICKYLESI